MKWHIKQSPLKQGFGNKFGWFGKLDKVYTSDDGMYCVMSREVKTEWGNVVHVCMRNKNETDISWSEKQRIKQELYGDRTAVEVFPTIKNLVDEANMYHLWVFDKKFKLPFGLKNEEE